MRLWRNSLIVFGQKTFDYMGKMSGSIVMVKLPVLPCQHVWPVSWQKRFLAKNKMALVRQPPYSADLALYDFWLFPKLKTTLKETRFLSRKDIMEKTTSELRSIPEEEFKRCFQKWQRCRKKCVHLQGEYFEED